MTRSEPTSSGRTARWLLLLGTLLGLAAMHTLGHCGVRMDTHRAAIMISDAAVMATVSASSGAGAADDDCDGQCAMSGWSICLAVLGGLTVFALLAALLVAWRGERDRAHGTRSSVPRGARSPPRRRPGLILASAAVLRL